MKRKVKDTELCTGHYRTVAPGDKLGIKKDAVSLGKPMYEWT